MVIKLLIMALAYISFGTSPASTGGMLITGLSSDTKPASPVNGWVFLETNTAKMFIANAGARTSTTILPFANGGISGSAAAPATTGTMTVPMTSSIITITPTGNCTFNASGGVAGQIITFHITTSGTTSFTLTFGTNFRKTGTLATGTTSARFFSISFRCLDGTIWTEIARTASQT